METRQDEQVKQIYLLQEVIRNKELARALKDRICDVFVKKQVTKEKDDEAPPLNPIDFAIAISQSTQAILQGCLELLEIEIISKLVG